MTDARKLADLIESGQVLLIASTPFQAPPAGSKEAVIAALRASPLYVGVPEGWKLVPIEPTGEMTEAGDLFFTNASFQNVSGAQINRIYRDMLAAAPTISSVPSTTGVKR